MLYNKIINMVKENSFKNNNLQQREREREREN